jgi:hypothetical protein
MSRILKWIVEQFLHVLPAVVFFFVAFLVISFTTALMVRKHGITITTLSSIAFGALVVGKVVMVVDNLSFANAFAGKPLIYNTLWKTFIYSLAGFAFRLMEEFVPFIADRGNATTAYDYLSSLDWPRFWAVQIWVVLLFFFFAVVREFIRVLGQDRVRKMFFGG